MLRCIALLLKISKKFRKAKLQIGVFLSNKKLLVYESDKLVQVLKPFH